MFSRKSVQRPALVILSVLFVSCSSCKKFDWEPRPYVGDSPNLQLVNEFGENIKCDQPAFDEMTCFDAENIAELKSAIDQVKDSKLRRKLQKSFSRSLIRNK